MKITKVFYVFALLFLINKTESYDYFKHSIQWSPTFCSVQKCVTPIPVSFNIHGLWPELNSGVGTLNFCTTSIQYQRTQLSTIIPRLQVSWRTLTGRGQIAEDSWWKHEWDKHGSCSAHTFDLLAYFTRGLDLYDQTAQNMLTELQNHGISPGGQAMHLTVFQNAIQQVHNVATELTCSNGNSNEVRFCLDADGHTFRNCSSHGNCNTAPITLPR